MLQTIQLSLSDQRLAATVREAVCRNCAWHVESVQRPDPSSPNVLVVDEESFARLPLPLLHPERIVLVSRKNPQLMAEAWNAGIVSVLSDDDSPNTVLLAIMAASLRVAKSSGISPRYSSKTARLAPQNKALESKTLKIQ